MKNSVKKSAGPVTVGRTRHVGQPSAARPVPQWRHSDRRERKGLLCTCEERAVQRRKKEAVLKSVSEKKRSVHKLKTN